jgi:hypothetical protein
VPEIVLLTEVRKANVRDASAIAHVHLQSWQTTYAGIVPDEYLASLNEVERVQLWGSGSLATFRSLSPK